MSRSESSTRTTYRGLLWPTSGSARVRDAVRVAMQINVNGQNYTRWEDVPAEVRQQLAATLPDADKNGVPDLFETGALPTGAQTFPHLDLGQRADGQSVADLPPDVRESCTRPSACRADVRYAASRRPLRPAPGRAGHAPAWPLQPGQVMLNGVPTDVANAVEDKKSWWRRLFGG